MSTIVTESRPSTQPTPATERTPALRGAIWIDLENSPNVPFFKPIIRELERRGYPVAVTARDCFQVCELAELLNVSCKTIGRHYGKNRAMKLLGLAIRTMQLLPVALLSRPSLAVSHGSRAQLLASKLLGVSTLQILDYEFTTSWMLIRPSWAMMPAVIESGAVKQDCRRILKYPGIKEDVYVPSFQPDSRLRRTLGISDSEILVCMRPPASEAHYHRPESDELFNAAVDYLAGHRTTRLLVLPRNDRQAAALRSAWPDLCASKKMLINERVVDGLNLIWNSDLVVSGGGTMNREAAALGVPVYSVFRGETGAVDRYLADTGRLVMLRSADELRAKVCIQRRERSVNALRTHTPTLDSIVNQIIELYHGCTNPSPRY